MRLVVAVSRATPQATSSWRRADAVCSNRKELWQLEVGEEWACKLDYEGFIHFRDMVLNRGGRGRG